MSNSTPKGSVARQLSNALSTSKRRSTTARPSIVSEGLCGTSTLACFVYGGG